MSDCREWLVEPPLESFRFGLFRMLFFVETFSLILNRNNILINLHFWLISLRRKKINFENFQEMLKNEQKLKMCCDRCSIFNGILKMFILPLFFNFRWKKDEKFFFKLKERDLEIVFRDKRCRASLLSFRQKKRSDKNFELFWRYATFFFSFVSFENSLFRSFTGSMTFGPTATGRKSKSRVWISPNRGT